MISDIRSLSDVEFRPIDEEAFGLWAFGEGWHDMTMYETMERWNERHGGLLLLHGDGCIQLDLERMIDVWKEQT